MSEQGSSTVLPSSLTVPIQRTIHKMKPQPSLCVLAAFAVAGALLIGCEGGIDQLQPGASNENELVAAYVDPIDVKPGVNPRLGGDGDLLPVIDGDAQDREWSVAQPLYVYLSGERGFGGPGFYAELRAIWSDESHLGATFKNYVYFLVRYGDDTYDIYPDYWHYARQGPLGLEPSQTPATGQCDSVIVTGANWYVENASTQEDQVAMMFEMEPASDATGSYSEIGCQVACHAGGGHSFGAVPTGKLDVWVWRAGRTNAQESTAYPDLTQIDEKTGRPNSIFSRIDTDNTWPAYMEDMIATSAGLQNDANDPNYLFSLFGYTGQLYNRNVSVSPVDGGEIPGNITELVRDRREGTGGTAQQEDTGPANGGLPLIMYLWGPTAQRFTSCDTVVTTRPIGSKYPKWSTGLLAGDTDVMPGYVIWIPSGSAADVRAKGEYKTNQSKRFSTWILEVRRPMTTDHPDDVAMDPAQEYLFTVAIFDKSSQIHSGSGPLRLRFQPSIYSRAPQPVGGGRDS